MSRHTSLKTGGEARYLAFPENLTQIMVLLEAARSEGVPIAVVGSLTNMLISDEPFDGLIMAMSHLKGITIKGDLLTAYSGEMLDYVINRAIEHNLTGLEQLGGIPGTIGGAVAGNAGAYGRQIADVFFYADCVDFNGNLKRFPSYIDRFSYRTSPFTEGHIIISAAFRLSPSRNTVAARKIKEEYRRERSEKGQYQYPSAGCIFRNPEGYSAGRLIDECGLKGRTIGGALVSEAHANFIVNKGGATSRDIYELSQLVRDEVKKQKDIDLEYEIRLLGRF